MEKTTYLPNTTVRLEAHMAKWKSAMTALVMLCAVAAIFIGIVWLFLRKDILLFATLGFGACYLIGRDFWRFGSRSFSTRD